MFSGLCLWRSGGSLTTPGPLEAHPHNLGVFFKPVYNPFILSQQLKNTNISRMAPISLLILVLTKLLAMLVINTYDKTKIQLGTQL